jgi:hypothetical protein
MHEFFFLQEVFFALAVVRIIHAAVHGTYRGTLGFIVEAYALRALLSDDEIDVHAAGLL